MMENAWECHIFRASTTWTPGKAGSSGILRPGLVHLEPLHGQFVSGREIYGNLMIMRMRMKMIVVVAVVLLFLPVLVQVLFVPTCMCLLLKSWDIMRYYYYCGCLVHPSIPGIADCWSSVRSSSERPQVSSTVLRCLDTSGCDGHFLDSCLQKALN
jgi:hypothetical protein